MAWDKDKPTNSGLLINFPAQCRANWEAIETGTDSDLQVTNAKVSSSAAINESKILFDGTDGHGHTGGTDGKAVSDSFVTGDWIVSSVDTAHSGWTNVSASYSNKFMRINATPLTTGGTDSHNHGGTTGSHTLTEAEIPAHTHTCYQYSQNGDDGDRNSNYVRRSENASAASGSTGGGGGHTHTVASADNIPAYVQVVIFQKD